MRASSLATLICCALAAPLALAQQAPATPPASARAAAPVDFTGTWVSPVMEDWRWRMVTPLKGDAASIPVNAAARAVIDAWDPAKDEAAGDLCKAYGAPALLRVPGRLRIRWLDDDTLEIQADAGRQTRVLHFGAAPPAGIEPSRQGYSQAGWSFLTARPGPGGVPLGMAPGRPAPSRTLEVTTTHLLPGYLRKNGVPYSGETSVLEYFDLFTEPDGAQWFTVTTIVTDPVYLGLPFVTTTDFRKERDGANFNPRPCMAR
ncbi:MAG TPA: hypothetical protein VM692_03095 [Gammaproteobacteria bacterium]|nr:hypothetical protein [Gammaproteobacteria bacterium]